MSKEDSLHERDYFVLAERNVGQRRKQQQSLLGKLRLPEPGELVRDKELVEDEKRAKQQKQQEEYQKKLQEQQSGYLPEQLQFPGLNPPSSLFPKREERGIFPSSFTSQPGIIVNFLYFRTEFNLHNSYSIEGTQTSQVPLGESLEIRSTQLGTAEPPIGNYFIHVE